VSRLNRRSAAFCVLAIAAARPAAAQHVATSFEQLRVLVDRGDIVTVRRTAGGHVRGSIADLSGSQLTLIVGGAARTVDRSEVDTIATRRHGSLATGAKWGLSSGIALGLVSAAGARFGGPGFFMVDAAVWSALGTGVGVGISAATVHQQLVYRSAPAQKPVALSPIITRGRAGALLVLRF
jgi:hypothetical protein